MASPGNDGSSDRHNPQSIPLRDLTRPPDSAISGRERYGRRRTNSNSSTEDQGRYSFVRRSLGRGVGGRRYERIAEDSPNSGDREHSDGFQTINLSQENDATGYAEDSRPYEVPPEFQQAISSVGLSFNDPSTRHSPDFQQQTSIERHDPGSSDNPDDFPYIEREISAGQDQYFSPTDGTDNDTTPLTNQAYSQSANTTTQNHGALGGNSLRFAPDRTPSVSRLGDDLPHNLEDGLGRGRHSNGSQGDGLRASRNNSQLSPSSPSALSRASSMMRMMSQRVVNLSNEPEVVEHNIRRKSSVRQSRLEAPPSLPAMTDYAHDSSGTSQLGDDGPREKKMPFLATSRERKAWSRHPNPLKGHSLGIFSPESKLRNFLCNILIHPVTEPIILFLIICQTVLLALEASLSPTKRDDMWGTSMLDYFFLGIFLIYTLELIARTIVSGFVFNPEEYSTLDRSLGLRKALIAKGSDLFKMQRQTSTRKSASPVNPQVSILRSFTGLQPEGPSGDPAQSQRVRLARRAFMRHSFNRLDFVAVVSYWISFLLSISSVETTSRLHLFRMLSSLRILRLLALTSGTSVRYRTQNSTANF